MPSIEYARLMGSQAAQALASFPVSTYDDLLLDSVLVQLLPIGLLPSVRKIYSAFTQHASYRDAPTVCDCAMHGRIPSPWF